MKLSKIFNIIGTTLITCVLVLHIVCTATPYYSEVDLNDIGRRLADMVRKNISLVGSEEGVGKPSMNQVNKVLGGLLSVKGSMNFGLWKMCVVEISEETSVDTCVKWGSENTFNLRKPTTLETSGWVRVVQAMAILGVMIGIVATVLAFINLIIKSKGDRLRLMHIFIASCCVVAGIFMLIGDLIMAANYKCIFDTLIASQRMPPPPGVMDLFKEEFHLSWSFALDVVAVALSLLSGLAHLMGGRIALHEIGEA